ncbi:alpha/beta hydrolase [Aridibaculum aurantiacum]|uniref:alpha/beta hydrolase n=1 Tax=Aridibaculum aurantiacum TaxID=2810307 RepID=UPI001A95FB45|nr:alpha/beta hydrolase-fold protein [Aridibaculum aurantiacum]
MAEEKTAPSPKSLSSVLVETLTIYSEFLERDVEVDAYLPTDIVIPEDVSLLIINDGQDLVKMPFDEMIDELMSTGKIQKIMCLGIHCGPERKMEYGTVCTADYEGRGAKAGLYSKFVFDELLPFIRKKYHIASFKEKAFAGFSLGGLSALDLVWNNASEFSKVGVFSGSLWWRRKGYDDGYNDEKDRIMHLQVQKGRFHPWLQFFFQTGLLDETADRNNNGIIDSVDDALDMILSLKSKGYTDDHINYLELPDGRHDVETWAKALPKFLKWGWGK